MKKLLIVILTILPLISHADPSPFGLQIGKSSIDDAKAKYSILNPGINKYSKGEMFDLNLSTVNFEGLQKATVIFNKDKKLLAVLTTLHKNKFNYLLEVLSKKYQLVKKNIPFVGNKSATLIDGNTEITLNAAHMGFTMEMNYISKELMDIFKAQSKAEQQQKQKKEQSQL